MDRCGNGKNRFRWATQDGMEGVGGQKYARRPAIVWKMVTMTKIGLVTGAIKRERVKCVDISIKNWLQVWSKETNHLLLYLSFLPTDQLLN